MIFGMPKVAIEQKVVQAVLDPEEIAPRLVALAKRSLA